MIAKKRMGSVSGFSAENHLVRRTIWISPKRIVFYLVFFLVFCFSGLLTVLTIMLGGFQYRMGLVSALVVPLLLIYGVKLKRVSVAYVALAGVVFLSGLYNNSSLREIILFMRILGFSYLMYKLVDLYVRPDNIIHIIRLCVSIAMIQLPIIALQQLFFDRLPARVKANVSIIDFDFGTFNFKCDASMAFFLTLIVIFLLFDHKRNYIVRHKWFVLFWLTLTILVTNAEIVKLIIFLVWGIYLVRYLSIKTIIYSVAIFLLLVTVLMPLGLFNEIWSDLTHSLISNTQVDPGKQESFFSGSYARGAAISYYLDRSLLWLGDGPSRYYDVLSRDYLMGNQGHLFTFYSEIGILGWLVSALILLFIAFPGRQANNDSPLVNWLLFISVQILSLTTQVMNDIGIILTLCIVARSYMIPVRSQKNTNMQRGK